MRYMDLRKRPLDWETFIKHLEVYYNSDRGFSRILPKWAKHPKKHTWVIEIYSLRELGYYPGEINDIINIIRALQKLGNIDYEGMVLDARLIYDTRRTEIFGYMKKIPWDKSRIMSRERAYKELIARGFKPLKSVRINMKLPYIHTVGQDLVYPRQWYTDIHNPFGGIYEKFGRIGIQGHNGITFPKNK